jgi:hypothetical protein
VWHWRELDYLFRSLQSRNQRVALAEQIRHIVVCMEPSGILSGIRLSAGVRTSKLFHARDRLGSI